MQCLQSVHIFSLNISCTEVKIVKISNKYFSHKITAVMEQLVVQHELNEVITVKAVLWNEVNPIKSQSH